ncbi:MAG: DUF5681 domain-containing protein [Phycisphaerales bacterium]|nr:DUF5681 domain-containing protein [Phycisphaerales bacterium]
MNNNDGSTGNGSRLGGCTGKGFMPGQSGNPAGRPKGSGLTDRLRRVLDQDDGAAMDRIVQAVVEAAERGDVAFVRLVWDRIEGRTPTRRDLADAEIDELLGGSPSLKLAAILGGVLDLDESATG